MAKEEDEQAQVPQAPQEDQVPAQKQITFLRFDTGGVP
jgi:hypothetical protein